MRAANCYSIGIEKAFKQPLEHVCISGHKKKRGDDLE